MVVVTTVLPADGGRSRRSTSAHQFNRIRDIPSWIVDRFLPGWLARDIVEEMGRMNQLLEGETLAGKASYPG